MTVITNYEKDVPKSPYFKLQNSAKDENMFCHHLIFSGIQMTTRDRGRSVGRFPKCVYIYISYRVISYHIISYYIILYHIISYHIISYYIILYYIILYHIILYHIILYYIIFAYLTMKHTTKGWVCKSEV